MCDDCSESTSTSDTSCDISSDKSCDTSTDMSTDITSELPEDMGDLSNDGSDELVDDSDANLDNEELVSEEHSEEVANDEHEFAIVSKEVEEISNNSEAAKSFTKGFLNDDINKLVDISKDNLVEKSLDDVSEKTLSDTEHQGTTYYLDCRNQDFAGSMHPKTGVPFEERQIPIGNDIYCVVSPIFKSYSDFTLPNELCQATDKEQFTFCNVQLEEELAKNPDLESQFSREQLSQIMEGRTPDGYTWHHDSYVGRMQLVDMKTHYLTGHTGGRSIWGGGSKNR